MLHSVPVGSGASDLDHVVIGPAGGFTINTKHHRGQHVWMATKRMLVSGQRTDHLAAPWYVGALGELEVGRRLAGLGAGWVVLHSVPVGTGSSDLDHVVIGPGGVFTIYTKHHRGRNVWVGAKRILVNGQRTDHLRNAKYEATRTSDLLSFAARMLVDVTPIVAIVGAKRMSLRERPTDVVVLREHEVVRWLQRHPITLTPEQVQHVAAVAAQPATWKRMAETDTVDHAAFERLHRDIGRARRRRMVWAGALLAALPVGAWATCSAGIGAITG